MKGQSLVIQYLMFFTIGFIVFLIITNWFQNRSVIFQDYTSEVQRENLAHYIFLNSLILYLSGSDYSEINLTVPNKTVGYYHLFSFEDNKDLYVVSVQTNKGTYKSLMGLNFSSIFFLLSFTISLGV